MTPHTPLLDPTTGVCVWCDGLELPAAPPLTAEEAAAVTFTDAQNALLAMSDVDWCRDECAAQLEICEGAARLLRDYPGSLPARMRTGFTQAGVLFRLWLEFWDVEEYAPMQRRLLAYLGPTKAFAGQWAKGLELERGQRLARRAAGAD